MYSILSDFSLTITEPISMFLNSYKHSAFIVAILLGLIGAFAPCQLTGNISAITLYGNRTIRMDNNWGEIISFITGKVVVYSLIGLFAWLFGQSFETRITEYFPIFRKIIGPLMIITGLVLLGIMKLKFLNKVSLQIPTSLKEGKIGSFLLGASFALAFCPTMFVLFFVWLMPTVVSTSYGLVLPAIFGIATSVPLIIILGLIWYFDIKGYIMKKSMKVGRWVQKAAGVILIIIGVLDTITYWGI
ncbi:cytochrome C biosynthesis protein [Ureibacillus massiliensis 4400831 = CIP 108448 = CCUG 49529]|uniref:Cytochrome C biosynthesis protein n=1 Tax=Ureibacillus massiliensis 4400831 = CIP 108448 = CCUG 49529 TaxID=1211035 RepID=A0A0A3ITD1_9BACL|nr:sulfite exporter TauE/SafE family protein [Ureibacillus massiliensis]KGR87976.1 cytochrome C biosynthesis protein [Ureibacillus massiliensis 4400831 = CIP 108448 = CCUG 49529]BDH63568.1 cytochrome c biosynthesis protein [Lysinibacillus sp. PLM2]